MIRRRLGLWLLAAGGAAAIGLLGWVGAGAIGADVLRAGWAIPVAVGLHAVQLWISAIAWRGASGGGGPSLAGWLRIRWIRESVNSLLPVAQLGGPVVGIRLLARRGVSAARGGAGTTLDVTLESASQILFTLAGLMALALVAPGAAWRPWLGGAAALMAVWVGGLVLVQRAGLLRLIEALTARLGRVLPGLRANALSGLHAELMRLQRDPAALVRAGGLHLLAWAIGTAETWVALWAMGSPVSPAVALVIESLGMAVHSAGFAVPGALGVQEGGFVLVGGLVGLPADAAVALSMVKRARELAVGLPGLLAWNWSEVRRIATPVERRTGWRNTGSAQPLTAHVEESRR